MIFRSFQERSIVPFDLRCSWLNDGSRYTKANEHAIRKPPAALWDLRVPDIPFCIAGYPVCTPQMFCFVQVRATFCGSWIARTRYGSRVFSFDPPVIIWIILIRRPFAEVAEHIIDSEDIGF